MAPQVFFAPHELGFRCRGAVHLAVVKLGFDDSGDELDTESVCSYGNIYMGGRTT